MNFTLFSIKKLYKKIFIKPKYGYIGVNVTYSASLKGISYPSNIIFDDYSSIGSEVVLYASEKSKIVIGKGSFIAPRCKIITSNHNYNSLDLRSIPFDNRNFVSDIVIGEGVWIGESVIILQGVTIGKGCVVGAGSIVTKSLPDYSIAVGNPAKIIKTRDRKIFDYHLSNNCFYKNNEVNKNNKKEFINLKELK